MSSDGKFIASGSNDKTVKLWEVKSGKLLQTFNGHFNFIRSVSLGLDGRFIASGSCDKTIKLWEAESGKLLQTFNGHSGWVNSVSLSLDGKFIASGSVDKTVKLWKVKSGKLLQTFNGPDFTSHNFTVLSLLPEAINLPSELMLTLITLDECPLKVFLTIPRLASSSFVFVRFALPKKLSNNILPLKFAPEKSVPPKCSS